MNIQTGKIVITARAAEILNEQDILNSLSRHIRGDFGDLESEDVAENILAIVNGGRILSSYTSSNNKFWIITEADRTITTILLPEEY